MSEELSPADEARLRRLLGRARHDEPVPADVAARLDDVLARLEGDEVPHDLHDDLDGYAAAARASSGSPAAGAAPSRRPRRGLTLLVAAAAVVVVGVGADQLLDRTGSGGDMAASTEDAGAAELADPTEGRASDEDLVEMEAQEQDAEAYALDASPEAATDGGSAAGSMRAVPGDLVVVGGRLVEVQEGSFADVAERLQRRLDGAGPAAARAQGQELLRDAAPRVQRAWQGCTPPEVGPGTPVAVLYDGSPAVLVLRPVEGATQVAALLQCGTGEVLRSVTLPVP